MGMGERDLITKDFALYVVHYFNSMQTWSKEDILGEIDRTIKDAKAEDAVRVVRCKDCWKSAEGLCSYQFKDVPGKDFCGDGERIER